VPNGDVMRVPPIFNCGGEWGEQMKTLNVAGFFAKPRSITIPSPTKTSLKPLGKYSKMTQWKGPPNLGTANDLKMT